MRIANSNITLSRNSNLDFARGLAILIMLLANSAPYLLKSGEVPFYARLLFSSAAPIFIFLSGYSLNLSFKNNKSLIKIISRSLQILLIAILIDSIIWKIIPFETFDVLYFIGISQHLLIAIHKLKPKFKLFLLLFSIVFYVVATLQFTYRFQIGENSFSPDNFNLFSLKSSLTRMLIDGWFPLLPWFSIALLGYLAKDYNFNLLKIKYPVVLGIILMVSSYVLFNLVPDSVNSPRENYLELFYPIKLIFGLFLCGLFTLLTAFINSKFEIKSFLTNIGKLSLFVYLIHTLIISFLLTKFHFTIINAFTTFIITELLFITTILIICNLINIVKPYLMKYKMTKPILFLLGL